MYNEEEKETKVNRAVLFVVAISMTMFNLDIVYLLTGPWSWCTSNSFVLFNIILLILVISGFIKRVVHIDKEPNQN